MASHIAHMLRWPLLATGLAMLVLSTTSATAANKDDPFLLGDQNQIDLTTTLYGTTAGPQLDVLNLDKLHPAIQAKGWYGGIAVYGQHVSTTGTAPALRGDSASTAAGAFGLYGLISSTTPGSSSAALRGQSNGTGASGIGVWGSQAGSGFGVYGTAQSGRGVYGNSSAGTGVYGLHSATAGTSPGVYGKSSSASDGASAVYGLASATPNGYSAAVYGQHLGGCAPAYGFCSLGVEGKAANGIGVWGEGAVGVFGRGTPAAEFDGNVYVHGTLSKTAGNFRIDDPADPADKYLQHSFVESPDMMDIYNGNVTTDAAGFATVRLPSYFQALNRTFRYQLTTVGRTFARAVVWREIAGNRFTIRTDRPSVKVSWQVTGIRHDPYANAHRIRVVVNKAPAERGKYLYPDIYGRSKTAAVGYPSNPSARVLSAAGR
jgi:hypothetical protein